MISENSAGEQRHATQLGGKRGSCPPSSSPTSTADSENVATASIPPKQKVLQILLVGCGNAVHTAIAYLGGQSMMTNYTNFPNAPSYEFKVNVLSLGHCRRLLSSVKPDGYIRCINDMGNDRYGKASTISSDPAEVVPGSNIILFALPTDRHELYLKAMLPYIQEGTYIGSMPGEGGFDLCVRNVLGQDLAEKCILFSLETLPWACRIQTFGQVVQVLGTKKDIDLCVYPGNRCWEGRDIVQSMIGPLPVVKTSPTSTFLGVPLMNPNSIAHPSILYGLLRNWDGVTPYSKPPLFYQGLDDFTAEIMDRVSKEILLVKDKILSEYPSIDLDLVRSIGDFFEEAYADDIADHSTLRNMFVSNKGYDGLTFPTVKVEGGYLPLFDHRYLTEDLPCGMLVQKGIAQLAGVPTPTMDRVISWCQTKCVPPKEYIVDGHYLAGSDLATTKTPQRYGFHDLKSFMESNGYV